MYECYLTSGIESAIAVSQNQENVKIITKQN